MGVNPYITYGQFSISSTSQHLHIQPTTDSVVLRCLLLKNILYKWTLTVQSHCSRANCIMLNFTSNLLALFLYQLWLFYLKYVCDLWLGSSVVTGVGTVSYPQKASGVSRHHCMLWLCTAYMWWHFKILIFYIIKWNTVCTLECSFWAIKPWTLIIQ